MWSFRVPWSPGFASGLPPWGVFWKWSKWPWNMIHWMPRRNPWRLYISHILTYSVGLSSVVWSELGPISPFPPMRVLEVKWSRALSLVCEVALTNTRIPTNYALKIFSDNIAWQALRKMNWICLERVWGIIGWDPSVFRVQFGCMTIMLFKSTTMFRGTDNIMRDIPHIILLIVENVVMNLNNVTTLTSSNISFINLRVYMFFKLL